MPKSQYDTDTAAAILHGWGCFPTREDRLQAAFVVGNHPERFSVELQREARALLARSSRHGASEARRRIEHHLQQTEPLAAA